MLKELFLINYVLKIYDGEIEQNLIITVQDMETEAPNSHLRVHVP